MVTRLTRDGVVLAGFAALFAPTLAAQAPTADPLSAVVAEALASNLGLAQEDRAVERAEAGVRDARGRFLPSLSLDFRYSEQSGTLNLGDFVNPAYAALNQVTGSNQFPTDLDITLPLKHESRLRLVQPLFDASILAAHALARQARNGQRLERAAAARRLAAEAQAAFLQVGAARSGRRTWEATLDLLRESERVAQRLVDAGKATPDQVFRARAERSDAEQQLAEARRIEDAAARAFNRILRRPLETPVTELPDSLLQFEIALSADEAVARALARREELAQADAGIGAARAGVRLASASFLPSVALAILAVLVLEFRTFRGTLIVASVIPLGLAGGLAALFLTGHTLSFAAMIGFVALIGIEIKTSILLVDFTNQLRARGMGLQEAIRRAGEVRFLPIVLTSLTAIGGLLPLAVQGQALYAPLAWVIIGGLVSSTLLARVVTPVLYGIWPPAVEGADGRTSGQGGKDGPAPS
jgi:hypothetical protein